MSMHVALISFFINNFLVSGEKFDRKIKLICLKLYTKYLIYPILSEFRET